MHAYIKVKLVCKILIVAILEWTKIISDQAIMLFYTGGYIVGNGNVEYVHFNQLKLLFIAGSTNLDSCYPLMITKISHFLYKIQYLLLEIILKMIISPIKSERLP